MRGGKLICFTGKMAAGKSTLARELAQRENAILLVEDHFLASLFPNEITDVDQYVRCSARIKVTLASLICDLLSRGLVVVLDFAGATRNQRAWFRELIDRSGAAHELHLIEASNEVCKRQLRARSEVLPAGHRWTSDAEFDLITSYFQQPTEDEGFQIIRHQRT